MMRFALTATFIFLCTALGYSQFTGPQQQQPRQPQVVDGVAAVVNNEVITISQVRDALQGRERTLRDVYSGAELEKKMTEIRNSILKELIDRQLILQEFKKLQEKGANIPEYAIDNKIQEIIRNDFAGDRTAFVRTLQAQGYTLTRFKEIQRDIIIVQAMRQSKMSDSFVISPIQIQNFYEKNKSTYSTPEQVKLRMIILREGDDVVGGSKKQTAQEIRQKIAEGAEFDRMAQMYSEDETTQEAGGDWGWIERNTLNEDLTRIAFNLKAGEISPVVELQGTYYILQVEARKNAQIKPISEVREQIERDLVQQERQKSQDRWLNSLRQKAYIKILT